jgi:pyruvate,water dikinase
MNVGNPEMAFGLASIPCDGVGLARLEFIIANHIKVHPLALIHFEQLEDPLVKQEVAALVAHYPYKPDYFVDKLAHGVGTIAAAFYPKPVVVRMSDFKSNEYANLLGGQEFEPREENPMLGLRGVRLGIHIPELTTMQVRAIFEAACKVSKEGIDVHPEIMIPLTSHVNELKRQREVLEIEANIVMEEQGIVLDYKFGTMIEIPRACVTATEIASVAEFFSFGTNDLTQMTFGYSRDDAERNFLVKYVEEGILRSGFA